MESLQWSRSAVKTMQTVISELNNGSIHQHAVRPGPSTRSRVSLFDLEHRQSRMRELLGQYGTANPEMAKGEADWQLFSLRLDAHQVQPFRRHVSRQTLWDRAGPVRGVEEEMRWWKYPRWLKIGNGNPRYRLSI